MENEKWQREQAAEQPDRETAHRCVDILIRTMERCFHSESSLTVRALARALSEKYHIAHDVCLTAVWGSWARFVYRDCLPRFVDFAAEVMEVPPEPTPEQMAVAGIEALEAFFKSLDLPTNIPSLGILPTDTELLELAHQCALSAGGVDGEKTLTEEDVYRVYKMANSAR